MKKFLSSPWALLAVIVLLRLPGFAFGVLNIDESDYLVYGAGILKGLLPYRDLVEIKPPLGYLTYALAGGLSIWPVRVLGVFWVFGTALLLRGAARRWTGSEEAGWAAAWMSILAGLVEVPAFGGEVMMNLPIAGAIWFFARSRKGRDLLACGICTGLATLYRHHAAVAAVAFGLALLVRPARGWTRAFAGVALLAAGTLAPWVVAGGVYALFGELPAFLDWTIGRNMAYATAASEGSSLARGVAPIALCVAAACVPWVLAARESLRPRADEVWRALSAMLWLTWLAVAAGGRFYEHYFLQFVPALSMLAAPSAAALALRWREIGRRTRALSLCGVAVPLAVWLAFTWGKGIGGAYPAQEPRTRALAFWLRANTASTDTLFVWGHYSPIYTLSGHLPGTRYVNTSVQMGNFDPARLPADFDPARHQSRRDIEATLSDLESRKPLWFVDTSPAGIHDWDHIPLSAFPELARYRDEHYQEVARAGGAPIYRRFTEGSTQAGEQRPLNSFRP
ncbi:MAG: ArnT family glycosyltransferase [Myxococcales bacterium]